MRTPREYDKHQRKMLLQRERRRRKRKLELQRRYRKKVRSDERERDSDDVAWFDNVAKLYKDCKYAFHFFGSVKRGHWLSKQLDVTEVGHCLCHDQDKKHRHVHSLIFSHVSNGALRQRYLRQGRGDANELEHHTKHSRVAIIKCADHLAHVIHYLACPAGQTIKSQRGRVHHHFNSNFPPYLRHYSFPKACNNIKDRCIRELEARGHRHPLDCPCKQTRDRFFKRCADNRNKQFRITKFAEDALKRLATDMAPAPEPPPPPAPPVVEPVAPAKPKRKIYD